MKKILRYLVLILILSFIGGVNYKFYTAKMITTEHKVLHKFIDTDSENKYRFILSDYSTVGVNADDYYSDKETYVYTYRDASVFSAFIAFVTIAFAFIGSVLSIFGFVVYLCSEAS